jgi:hypothetical protein
VHGRVLWSVGLSLEPRTLCKDRRDAQPRRMTHTDRHFFVGDEKLHSISVYSLLRNWTFVRTIGSDGRGAGQFRNPMGMCAYRDRLIACDMGNCRLQFIDISAADPAKWSFHSP